MCSNLGCAAESELESHAGRSIPRFCGNLLASRYDFDLTAGCAMIEPQWNRAVLGELGEPG